ncbi:DUF3068 domain-containing protein [Streptosporangium canum]|uniref:DUF3068 domain-containing protein n=1 Tax=Streptosporangium canum TaxID=324952 RepID=UPI003682405E
MRTQSLRSAAVAAGAFLITLAALFRFHVYESALVLPLEQNTNYRLATENATYFDFATFTLRTGVPLESVTLLSGDPGAGTEGTAVWTELTSIYARGNRIDYHERRAAFDRRTGLAVNCCGEYVDDDSQARHSGLAFRLPFRAEPRSYPMYDTILRRTVPLRFEREEEVEGLRTYRYTYTAGPIEIGDAPWDVPGKAVGLPERRTTGVSRYAEVTRTLWVEPESGLTVKVGERHRQSLRTLDGIERRVSLQADLVMFPEDVATQVAGARAFTRWALIVRDVAPGAFLVLGLGLGLLAVRLRGPEPAAMEPVVTEPVVTEPAVTETAAARTETA